jgi:hypothetical protein
LKLNSLRLKYLSSNTTQKKTFSSLNGNRLLHHITLELSHSVISLTYPPFDFVNTSFLMPIGFKSDSASCFLIFGCKCLKILVGIGLVLVVGFSPLAVVEAM